MKEFLKKYYKFNDEKKRKFFKKKKKFFIFGKILKKKKKKINNLYTYKKTSIYLQEPLFKKIKFHYPFNFKLLNKFWKI